MAHKLDKVGLLMFEFLCDPQLMEVHVFTTNNYSGTPSESDGKMCVCVCVCVCMCDTYIVNGPGNPQR